MVDSDRSVPVAPREFVELCNNLGSLGSSHTKDLYRRISSLEDRLHTHPRFVEGGESAENGVLVGDALRSHGARLEALERRQCSLDEAYEMAAAMAASNTVMDPLAAIKQVRDMQRNLEAKEAKGEVQNLWRSVGELMQANSELAHHHKNLVQRHGDLIQKHDKTVQKLGEITQQLAALKQEQVEQRKTVTATLVHQVDFAKGKITYTEASPHQHHPFSHFSQCPLLTIFVPVVG